MGVAEGGDSVLQERVGVAKEGGEEMDTIARSATHQYYLRSLYKPETVASIRGPRSNLEIPQHTGSDGASTAASVARGYRDFPSPSLPPPPAPQGQSSADLYQSLHTRDEGIRKSK